MANKNPPTRMVERRVPPANGTVIDERTQLRFTLSQFYQILIILAALTGIFFNLKGDLLDLKATLKGVYTKDEINEMLQKTDKELQEAKEIAARENQDLKIEIEKMKSVLETIGRNR